MIEWLHQPDYNGCRLLCEPAEPDPAPAGDPGDAQRLREALIGWHRAAIDVSRAIEPLSRADRCIIWGGGMHVEQLHAATPLFDGRPERGYVIVDSDPAKHGCTWRGIDILPPAEAFADTEAAGVPVLVSSYGDQREIARAAAELGAGQILTLYEEVNIH